MEGTPLTPGLVDKLLDKLGSDDQFRADFLKDPEAAMKQLGAPANFKCGGCLKPTQLASKDVIQHTRATIRNALLGVDEHEVQSLEPK
jgi:putative modified peptide